MEKDTKHAKKRKSIKKSKNHVSREESDSHHYKKKREKYHVSDDDGDRKHSSKHLRVYESDYRNNRKDFNRSSYRERDYENNRYYPTNNSNDPKHQKQNEKEKEKSPSPQEKKISEKPKIDDLSLKTGGAYIPPAKLRMMCRNITDKSTAAYQRIAWEALKKSIHGLINKVNISNIHIIVKNLFKENIIRGKGLLCKSLLQAQAASLKFTNIYTAVIAVVNSKFPNIGELLVTRCVIQFRNSYRRNDKNLCLAAVMFIAHLVNQRVAHEVLALEILTLLLQNTSNDSVEMAVSFLKECGEKLTQVCPKGLFSVFEMLRHILHENKLEKRIQYMIEVMHQVRKDKFKFKDYPALIDELDLIEEEDQFTHLILLDSKLESQDILNVFKFDPDYEENENQYKTLCKEILGSESEGDDGEEEGSDDEEDEDNSDEETAEAEQKELIKDETETNLVAFRRTAYLTINSSLDFEECAHKLLKIQMKPGQEMELCHMFRDCCAQQRTYEKFFGLLAQRFCQINRSYIDCLNEIFVDSYHTIHRLDSNRLRNAAKFFAHLFCSDAIPWTALSVIQLNEEDTTASGRVFIKILFQELAEYMGLPKLRNRILDPSLQEALQGIFPKDNPRNTRFSINFFTSIGLGGLTDELRDWLKSGAEVKIPVIEAVVEKTAKKN